MKSYVRYGISVGVLSAGLIVTGLATSQAAEAATPCTGFGPWVVAGGNGGTGGTGVYNGPSSFSLANVGVGAIGGTGGSIAHGAGGLFTYGGNGGDGGFGVYNGANSISGLNFGFGAPGGAGGNVF